MRTLLALLLAAFSASAQSVNWVTQLKNKPFLDVRQYGAKGNGVADDTAAIQAAVTAGYGRVVYLPAGTYKITSPISITTDAVTIAGESRHYTSITTSGITTGNAFTFDGTSDKSFNTIRDLTIACGSEHTTGYAVYATEQNYFKFSDLVITTCGNGVYINNANQFNGNNVVIRDLEQTTGIGISIDGSSTLAAFLNNIIVAGSTTPYAGIRIKECGDVTITNSHLMQSGYGLVAEPGTGETVASLKMSSVFFDNDQNDGLALLPTSTGQIVRGSCNGCWFGSSTDNGFYASATSPAVIDGFQIVDGQFFLNGDYGAVVEGSGTTNVAILSSRFSGNSQSASGTFGGAIFNTSNFQFVGNRSGQIDGLPNSQGYGLSVFAGSNNNYIVANNDLRGNITGAFSDGGTGTTKVIKNNLGVDSSPVTQASSATFALPVCDVVFVTGTTALSTIQNGHTGRTVTLIFTDAAPGGVTTGGNVAKAVAATQNQRISCTFNGTNWYCQ